MRESRQYVFLDPDDLNEIPFTTSKIVAENGKVKHHTIQRLIRNYEADLLEFGKVGFEIRPLESGQAEKVYHLNEEQATLLITYMKNTQPVRRFKKALVKQFFCMQKELNQRKVTRRVGLQARDALTRAISALPDSPHKAMKYKHYTDLVYKTLFGKNTKQLKQEHQLDPDSDLRNRFSAEQLDKLEALERRIGMLIEMGYDYREIKAMTAKLALLLPALKTKEDDNHATTRNLPAGIRIAPKPSYTLCHDKRRLLAP